MVGSGIRPGTNPRFGRISVRPGDPTERREIVAVSARAVASGLGFLDRVGDAVALRVFDCCFFGREAHFHLRAHIGLAGPAHKRINGAFGIGWKFDDPSLCLALPGGH